MSNMMVIRLFIGYVEIIFISIYFILISSNKSVDKKCIYSLVYSTFIYLTCSVGIPKLGMLGYFLVTFAIVVVVYKKNKIYWLYNCVIIFATMVVTQLAIDFIHTDILELSVHSYTYSMATAISLTLETIFLIILYRRNIYDLVVSIKQN